MKLGDSPLLSHPQNPIHAQQVARMEELLNLLRSSEGTWHDFSLRYKESIQYTSASPAVQACIGCLIDNNPDADRPLKRLARNHRRLDIGAWVLMYHTAPGAEVLTNTYTQLHTHHPELLSDQERTTLRHGLTIHTLVTTQQHENLLAYLAHLPREDQSSTIQAYKQLLINSLTHPNTMSAYYPYLPNEKTVDGYDHASLQIPDLGPYAAAYDNALDQLLTTQGALLPPRRPIDEIFHDLLLLNYLHAHQLSAEGFQQIIALRGDTAFGLINPAIRQNMVWVGEHQVDTPPDIPPSFDVASADPYLRHAVETLSSLFTTIQELLAYRAEIHEKAYDPTSNYLPILQKIRQHLLQISELHDRIDIHYFIRHLPSQSDTDRDLVSRVFEGIDTKYPIIELIKRLHLLCEPSTLMCASERQYALMSAAVLVAHGQHQQISMSAQTYQGLNNRDKTELLLPVSNVFDERSLILLKDFLTILATTSLHITHGRVLKRLRENFELPENADLSNGTTLILPFLGGHYHEAGVCSTLEQFLGALEQCRELIATNATQHNITLRKYTQPLPLEGVSVGSVIEVCYWIVDYLHRLFNENTKAYSELYNKIQNTVSGSVKTLELFFKTNHERILGTSTDGRTE